VTNDQQEDAPTVIEWSEPPVIVRGQRRSKYQGIIDALMDQPGKWALVMEHANPASAKVFSNHGCEITTRADGANRVNVWAMYPDDADDDGNVTDAEVDEAEADEADEPEVEVTSRPAARKRPVKRQAARG